MRKLSFLAALFFALPAYALPPSASVQTMVPHAQEVGGGRMTYLMFDVYDAALFAPEGHYDPNAPFALRLSYLRDLEGKDVAKRSIEEMRKQGFTDEVKLATWYSQLSAIFPDVHEGTVLTGIRTGDGETVFDEGGKEIGRIHDPEFTRAFFDIWLSPKTTDPELRAKLLASK